MASINHVDRKVGGEGHPEKTMKVNIQGVLQQTVLFIRSGMQRV